MTDPLTPDPRTSCPFCGTPGEYVTADEGTSYFRTARADTTALDVERLAVAINAAQVMGAEWWGRDLIPVAEKIARAYAALEATDD